MESTNIFISQTTGKSQEVAIVLQSWLRDEMRICVPWMSTDIGGGKNWRIEVGKALKKARFGILCLTTENLNNPWMLFEAGALYFNGIPIFPYAINLDNLRQMPSPIRNTQGREANKEGTKDLVFAINEALYNPISKQALEKTFNLKWKKLKKELDRILTITVNDYEEALQDFMDIIVSINKYRISLDFSPLVDQTIELFINQKHKIETVTETIVELGYEQIEEVRKKFARESILVGNVQDFFKEHFTKDDFRNIVVRLALRLCSELPPDKKREDLLLQIKEDLLLQIKKEESDVYVHYHMVLVERLRDHLP